MQERHVQGRRKRRSFFGVSTFGDDGLASHQSLQMKVVPSPRDLHPWSMVASVETALATLIGKYHDRTQGAGCQAVSHLGYKQNADQVLQETNPQQLLLRPTDGAASAEMAEHANDDRV